MSFIKNVIFYLPFVLNIGMIMYFLLVGIIAFSDKKYDKASCYFIILLFVFEVLTKVK